MYILVLIFSIKKVNIRFNHDFLLQNTYGKGFSSHIIIILRCKFHGNMISVSLIDVSSVWVFSLYICNTLHKISREPCACWPGDNEMNAQAYAKDLVCVFVLRPQGCVSFGPSWKTCCFQMIWILMFTNQKCFFLVNQT